MKKRAIVGLLLAGCVFSTSAIGTSESGMPFHERFDNMSWEDVVAEAEGQEVFFYMWGGSDAINEFVTGFVGGRLAAEYGVEMEVVPVADASVFVNRVLTERQAGRDQMGSVDLMWINGENFRTLREADLLFGPFASRLPSSQYLDLDDAAVAFDFGYPVEGYESPYGSAQFVMIYDSARVPEPPATIAALFDWIEANPGRFAYPAPPDFTGSAFVRHVFYHAAGEVERLLVPFDEELFDEVAAEAWNMLNNLEQYLWRDGDTYPESATIVEDLFANSEVDFDMAYNPAEAANLVAQGRYPETTRTFVFEGGTIGNTHYVAIPYNASHKAAALVTANLLLSPEAQYEKALPSVWGDLPVLDIDLLPERLQDAFASIPRSPSVLSPQVLSNAKLPELDAAWIQAIEEGWRETVLQQ